jgi:hypothetical protein
MLVCTAILAHHLEATARSITLYALVTLPGTFLHELAHYTTALILEGNPGSFNLIPNNSTLGYITFSPNWYNSATVALAPLLLAPLTVFFSALSAKSNNILKMILGGYLSACSWVACTPSPQDLHIAMVPSSWPLALCMLGSLTWIIYKIVKMMLK